MVKQSWENWRDYETNEQHEADTTITQTATHHSLTARAVPYEHIANDRVQRSVVEKAISAGADVDPRIIRALGLCLTNGMQQDIVDTPDITTIQTIPRIPYGGTESVYDVPTTVVVPNNIRAHLPA